MRLIGHLPINRTLRCVANVVVNVSRFERRAHTAYLGFAASSRVLRSAAFVRRDWRKRADRFPFAWRLSAIYRSFASKARLCTASQGLIILFLAALCTASRTIDVVCYRVIVSTLVVPCILQSRTSRHLFCCSLSLIYPFFKFFLILRRMLYRVFTRWVYCDILNDTHTHTHM